MTKISIKAYVFGLFLVIILALLYIWTVKDTKDNKINSLTSNSLNDNKVIVYSHDLKHWNQNHEVCKYPQTDRQAMLRTPLGPVFISVYNPKDDIFISSKIIRTGDFDGDKRQVLYDRLNVDDPDVNFIDIGCNIGVYTLTFAKLGRKVLCVDALYLNVQHVCASVVKNHLLNNVTVVLNALSNKRDIVELAIDAKNYGGTFVDTEADYIKMLKGRSVQGGHYTNVSSIVMDDLLELPGIYAFTKVFIKMDIEGFEAKALERASRFFNSIDVRGVLMEWIFHRGKQSGVRITNFMTRHNLFPYSPKSLRRLNLARQGNWSGMDVLWLKNRV